MVGIHGLASHLVSSVRDVARDLRAGIPETFFPDQGCGPIRLLGEGEDASSNDPDCPHRAGPPWRHRCGMMMTPYQKGTVMRIATVTIAELAGCATIPEMGRNALEVAGVEEAVVCSGACEEEWRRAEEWVKKYSGYAFPAEVTVTRDRIEASRVPIHNCASLSRTRRRSLCPELPLASEPLGFGDNDPPGSMLGKTVADGGPHWTFFVLRKVQEGGQSQIRLVQRCWPTRGSSTCDAPGIPRHRQDAFRRFVRTGEHLPR